MFLFGLVSILKGTSYLYSDEWQTTGGPAVMVWGFIVVGRGSCYRLRVSDLPNVI